MLSLRKKIIFSFFTIGAVLVLLVCLEFMLRVIQPRTGDAIVSTVAYDGIEWYKLDRSYLKKYFSSSDVLIPEFKEEQFRVKRTDRSIRIFCLGESSMFGVPYQMNANIPGIIRKQLRSLYPDREIEVINAGASAINSSVILDLARQITAYQPDLVLFYLGHNEFYGPDGVGVSKLEKMMPIMTDLKHLVKNSAIAAMTDSLFGSGKKDPMQARTLMQQVSNDTKVELASADAERIFSNYERNLRAMISVLQEKRIPMMFSDAASNLSFPPFEYNSPGAGVEKEVATLYVNNDFARLRDRLSELMKADTENAYLNYWMGMAEARLQRFDEARGHLIRGKDLDLLKFRAPERTNTILHSVCAELNVPVISSDSLLRAACAHGISDSTLFWEHVHPNAYGYYLIASRFIEAMAAYGLIPEPAPATSQRQVPEPAPGASQRLISMPKGVLSERLIPFQTDSLAICFLDLAYGDRTMKNLTSHWPFRNFSVTPAVLNTADEGQRDITEKMFGHELAWDEACYRSAALFMRAGRLRDAETTYDAVIEAYPYNYYAHYLLGSLLNRMNRSAQALKHFDIAVASNPSYAYARVERGLTNINFGKYNEALADFAAARQMGGAVEPTLPATISYGTAVVYANKREFAKALQFVDEALRIAPGYASAIQLRAGIVAAMK